LGLLLGEFNGIRDSFSPAGGILSFAPFARLVTEHPDMLGLKVGAIIASMENGDAGWALVRDMLNKPYDPPWPAQHSAMLAAVFVSLDTPEKQMQFLHYLADRIVPEPWTQIFTSGIIEGIDPLTAAEDIPIYRFCLNKVGGIRGELGGAITVLLAMQTEYERGTPEYNLLRDQRRPIMQSYALLHTVSTMMNPWGADQHRVENVFLGGENGPVRLVDENPGTRVIAQRIGKSTQTSTNNLGQVSTSIQLAPLPDREMIVGPVLGGAAADSQMTTLSRQSILPRHAFDIGAHSGPTLVSTFAILLATPFKKPVGLVVKGLDTANSLFFGGRTRAEAQADRAWESIEIFAYNEGTADAIDNLGIETVFVQDLNKRTFTPHIWATSVTLRSIEPLNDLANRDFSPADALYNLEGMIEAHRELATGDDRTIIDKLVERISSGGD
jgi:hypothetical protein